MIWPIAIRWKQVPTATWSGPMCLHAVALAVLILSAAGCSLPSAQLQLPDPIGGSTFGGVADRSGVRINDPADPEALQQRIYTGTGEHTGFAAPRPLGQSGTTQYAENEDGILLNFVDASVEEVARTILGEILKLNYAVSSSVTGRVTLNTVQPVPEGKLLELLDTILRSENAVLVVENGMHQILAADETKAVRGKVRWPRGGRGSTAGVTTEVITLRYVAAAEMERLVRSVAPGVEIVRTDEARNLIIVSGTGADLASVRETAQVFDVDWMRGMSFAILPVESSDPLAIAEELDTVFANDKESPTKGIVRFVPNKRLKSVLVISSRPEYLRKAAEWVHRLDKAGSASERQVHVYRVQHRPAVELAGLLRRVYLNGEFTDRGFEAATEPGRATTSLTSGRVEEAAIVLPQPGQGGATQGGANGPDPQPVTGSTPFNNVDPFAPGDQTVDAGGADTSRAQSGGISIVADETNNALIVTATEAEYKRVRQILWRIDIAAHQVLLEATIAEVSLNDQLRYGLKWFFRRGSSEVTLADNVLGVVAPAFPGFSYFLNMTNVQVALDALSDVTDVNIVSSPSLMTLDNKKAVLQVGAEVPIATQSAVAVTAPGAPVVNSISFRNTGVILGITPRVADDGRVLLEIEQEVSDVVPTTTSNLDSPTIQQRRIKTTVAVGNGESIVLAGFMQDRTTVERSQIPLLGDIPYLGNAFKSKSDRVDRTELLIAITPQVVKDHNQIRGIANEFRDRMNFTTRPQRSGKPDRRENVDRLFVR